jgi:hypothetical protein
MRGNFFEAVKALFPRSLAFQLFIDNAKRKLIEALSELPEDIRIEFEKIYFDLFPQTTRFPEQWERAFSLYLTNEEAEKRRDILDAHWKIISGDQGINFIQRVLQKIDNNIRVEENVPLSDPRSQQVVMICVCDNEDMVCDNDAACCDNRIGDDNFMPDVLQNDTSSVYAIPSDTRYWEMCFFVCKEVHRTPDGHITWVEPLELSRIWKNIVEYLVLKIKPVQSTAIIFIKWRD